MGQVYSQEYQLDDQSANDVADFELNSPSTNCSLDECKGDCAKGASCCCSNGGNNTKQQVVKKQLAVCKKQNLNQAEQEQQVQQQQQQQQQHVRKLSRNIQLLSMKAQNENDAYADGLRNRRRSSLINLILGAPSRGPRFSDDLCSLSSHQLSECNFGIEYFSEQVYNNQYYHQHAVATASISSSWRNNDSTLNEHHQNKLDLSYQKDDANCQQQLKRKSPLNGSVSCGPQGLTFASPVAAEAAANSSTKYNRQTRRRSSIGSLAMAQFVSSHGAKAINNEEPTSIQAASGNSNNNNTNNNNAPPRRPFIKQHSRKPSLNSMLASIDLKSSFEEHDKSFKNMARSNQLDSLYRTKSTIFESVSQESLNSNNNNNNNNIDDNLKSRFNSMYSGGRINKNARTLRRTGSELSLYSTVSGASSAPSHKSSISNSSNVSIGARRASKSMTNSKSNETNHHLKETKLIIMLQVCLPFILAGFGNMAAGLVLNKVAHWRAFQQVPIFFVLLPSFVGLKGNIEMTLASRLSTLSNLNLLDSSYQRKRAYITNLILILSQAIGLSVFASTIAIFCEIFISGSKLTTNIRELLEVSLFVVMASALATALILVTISSIIMSIAVCLANLIQVNPDNLSTLIAALYGDVSCVFIYGLIADWMFSMHERNVLIWPSLIITSTILLWPILLYIAYKLKETNSIALSSIPPMLMSIMISMGSGAILSIVVGKFKLIALYQPVVNGFGANLIAVQASRVSTWLWCSALRRISIVKEQQPSICLGDSNKKLVGSLASFTEPIKQISNNDKKSIDTNDNGNNSKKPDKPNLIELSVKLFKKILWSFFNSSPNSIAARLLLLMLIPAHSLYFLVIWLVSPTNYVVITLPFYLTYLSLCLVQVFILLTICEPLMTLLMSREFDPDIFGISILMALADLIGTICLTGAFFFLAKIGDVNAIMK